MQVSILYTAPTAIRALQSFGNQWPANYSRASLRILGTVGEPINPEAWQWYHEARRPTHMLPSLCAPGSALQPDRWTEESAASLVPPQSMHRLATLGRCA